MTIEDCLNAVQALGCGLVEITGGEPLLQPETRSYAAASSMQGTPYSLKPTEALTYQTPFSLRAHRGREMPGKRHGRIVYANNIKRFTGATSEIRHFRCS